MCQTLNGIAAKVFGALVVQETQGSSIVLEVVQLFREE
jgi:hypothetical protein